MPTGLLLPQRSEHVHHVPRVWLFLACRCVDLRVSRARARHIGRMPLRACYSHGPLPKTIEQSYYCLAGSASHSAAA